MDNLDDSENNAKISDSAYSNSCSNSQSRRSHSSKSTHSGSHSSGSSGYGGKPSVSTYSDNIDQPPEKRIKEKENKNKKQVQTDSLVVGGEEEIEIDPPELVTITESKKEENNEDEQTPSTSNTQQEKLITHEDISASDRSSVKEEATLCNGPLVPVNFDTSLVTSTSLCAVRNFNEGFSCVISMHDGVVMYTTSSLTTTLGFPKEMWIGRSFIDFVHPRDRNAFASQITSGLADPNKDKGTEEKAPTLTNSTTNMVCRIRRYRGLNSGFGIKERIINFLPFLLKLTFKNVNNEEGKAIYLVLQATPFTSAFKTPNEVLIKPVPFVIRHAANGNLEYIDPESVPYLGYLPQDIIDQDALQLYHPEDLGFLHQVYEKIVKEGGAPRSKTYRMVTQNGDCIKVETEWTSFINPWSRKLEFVIGKHFIMEGPINPDVFQTPNSEKKKMFTEEEIKKIHAIKESIIRTMNEVLTKPAEAAKSQMTKKCHVLASFMESLMEDQPKTDEDLRLEIQDADQSYYERDSVMLGGISPHHDFNDSKSSTDTPLSYNQLNYNETLQRYFDNHQPYSKEDSNVNDEHIFIDEMGLDSCDGNYMPSVAHNTGSSGLVSSCGSSMVIRGSSPFLPLGDYQSTRLTESLLSKHDIEMERELIKSHRETRSSKEERDKLSSENRQKKKEHIARCNAAYQPTPAENNLMESQPHGVKRPKQVDSEPNEPHKHHCSSSRQYRRKQYANAAHPHPPVTITSNIATQWPGTHVNEMNAFFLGVGVPPQMSFMSPVAPVPAGVFPMYYQPAMTTTANLNHQSPSCSNAQQFSQPAVQYLMYGHAMYGSPYMYPQMNPYPMQQNMVPPNFHMVNNVNPFGLARSNYEEACKPGLLVKTKSPSSRQWKEKRRAERPSTSKMDQGSILSTRALNRSNEPVPNMLDVRSEMMKGNVMSNSEEGIDRTDGESSYSSFYSSFFKTESGSADDSGEAKKANNSKPQPVKKIMRRKLEPPWMERVCVTSELIYQYQITTKNVDEVLKEDKQRMLNFVQPSLVNDQLGQLYLDLQLEGVAARLTLEEGITSSSSSGEETTPKSAKRFNKREYNKLVMIYEEDAPLPPGSDEEDAFPCPSTSYIAQDK